MPFLARFVNLGNECSEDFPHCLERLFIGWGMTVKGQNPALRKPTLEFLRRCAAANQSKADAFRAVALLAGFQAKFEIHTPFEVLQWN